MTPTVRVRHSDPQRPLELLGLADTPLQLTLTEARQLHELLGRRIALVEAGRP